MDQPTLRPRRRWAVGATVAASALAASALSFPPVQADPSDPVAPSGVTASTELQGPTAAPAKVDKSGPTDSTLRALVDLPAAQARAQAREQGLAVGDSGGRVLVEVRPSDGLAAVRNAVAAVGGEVTGGVDGYLVEAAVGISRVTELEQDDRVSSVSVPGNVAVSQSPPGVPTWAGRRQEHVEKINALPWRRAGFNGTGVKVGIVDTFDSQTWNRVGATGSVPNPAGLFCRHKGQACNIWQYGQGSQHGTAVAETIHDIAPGAQLYLASATTPSDLQAAVNFFQARGVKILSRSQGALYDGPGNGRGAVDSVVDSAVAKGMMWANSAGNSADRRYWRGSWMDQNANGWLEFAPGVELLQFACGLPLGFRWSDWGANRSDYDVYVFDTIAQAQAGIPEFAAEANQPGGAAPIEYLDYDHGFRTCDTGQGSADYLAVSRFAPGNGSANDVFEFSTNLGVQFNVWDVPFSATQPASDSANPGALSVGAVDPPLGTRIGVYSSQGPTNDGRIKPDISAASGFTSLSYNVPGFGARFNGTSASTPAVAGAAALVLDARPTLGPAALAGYLKGTARVDRGRAGPDNTFGHGELRLPAPPHARAKPGLPGKIKILKKKAKKAKIRWGAVRGATAYAVYLRKATKQQWRAVKGVKGTTVWLTKLRRGQRYVTAVAAYNGQWGDYRYKTFKHKVPRR